MFEPGTQLGRYEIQRRLGRGGMGTVYVAHDPLLGRMVAIKVFAGDLDVPDARERFSREARAAAALNHPNIVTVYDFGEFESQPYIVMEYVPGETMGNFIRRKVPVSISDKLRWIEELCAGAGYAHQMSVIHRDIKPANLMIDRSGRLKILDFGIARMLGIASNTSVMIGTPGYMAPEQITGDPIDHRADQFSIGVVFYELLAYTDAFPGDTLPAITHRILTEEPKPLLGAVPDASPEIAAIVQQSLRKNVAERFKDTEAMRLAIARARRHLAVDESWSGNNTMPMSRDITPPGGANRGTGSARRKVGDAAGVAQLTPPPDPRRADRETLAKRRAAQVEAALADARKLMTNQQLEAALDACQQALTLDENHVGALELEQEIETALGARAGVGDVVDDPDMTVASEPFASDPGGIGSRLFESQAVTRMHDEGYAVAGAGAAAAEPSALARQHEPLPLPKEDPPSFPPVEATIVVPSRRTPAPTQGVKPATIAPAPKAATIPPAAPPAMVTPAADETTLVPAAKVRVPAVPAPVVPSAPTKAKAPVQQSGPLSAVTTALDAVTTALRGITPATMPRQKALAIWGTIAGVVVIAIAATAYFATRGPAPTGVLVIDAVPWAAVSAIQDASGVPQTLPASASTPLSLSLRAGAYRVTLTGPPPESKVVTVEVRVDVNGVAVIPITRFQTVTPEQYFEQYLLSTASSEPAPAVQPAQTGASTPPAPAPQSGGNQ